MMVQNIYNKYIFLNSNIPYMYESFLFHYMYIHA